MLNKNSNESFTDYHIRLFKNMDTYKLTSDDIADLLNAEHGSKFGESKWRKDYAQYVRWKEYILKNESSQTELDMLTIKKLELQKERNKLSAEKNELNKWIREQARAENIYEKIEDAIAALEPIKLPTLTIEPSNKTKTAVIDIADAHFGREGVIKGLCGEIIAEYSIKIFENRMWELMKRTIEIVRREGITHVTVLNLSDSIDGCLRFNQLQFLQLGVVDQTMQFAEFMSEWLNYLSDYVTIDYRSVLGNHTETRPLNSQRGDFPKENMERIVTWYIKTRLATNNRVHVYDAENLIYFDVLGTKILASHGQDEKNLEQSIKDYTMIYQVPIHIFKTGHLHHLNNKTVGMSGGRNIEHIQSPAICGIDDYSIKLKKTSNAGSLITIFLEDYGKLFTYDVRLK